MAKSRKSSAAAEKAIKLLKEKSKKRKLAAPRPKQPVKPKVVRMVKPEAPKPAMKKQQYGKQDLDRFKEIILEKKKEILEELETLRDTMMDTTTGEYASENSMYSTHMEQGTDAMEREKTFLFASREGKFLNYLEDALQRIEKGEYGRCETCGKLIEKERLEAVPHARQCLDCKLRSQK
ncbi:MAG TPA: TraR/DksA C4-type zinc finger protein [Bacteroidota bacterium]|nr:TraR/DksA C4-type zinc finger protein [Bacteroidota bacterium]